MACRLISTKLIFWTEMGKLLIGPLETNFNEIFSFIRYISKGRLQNGDHFVSASMYCDIDYIYVGEHIASIMSLQ